MENTIVLSKPCASSLRTMVTVPPGLPAGAEVLRLPEGLAPAVDELLVLLPQAESRLVTPRAPVANIPVRSMLRRLIR